MNLLRSFSSCSIKDIKQGATLHWGNWDINNWIEQKESPFLKLTKRKE